MLKVSSRAHYGLRALTELAKVYDARTLSLSEIASVEHLPLPYLEQVVSPLRRAGLIEGTRGAHGGYRLTRDPSTIRIGEVVRVLEGEESLAPVECVSPNYVEGTCVRENECLSRPRWLSVKSAVDAVLDNTTLFDLTKGPAVTAHG